MDNTGTHLILKNPNSVYPEGTVIGYWHRTQFSRGKIIEYDDRKDEYIVLPEDSTYDYTTNVKPENIWFYKHKVL